MVRVSSDDECTVPPRRERTRASAASAKACSWRRRLVAVLAAASERAAWLATIVTLAGACQGDSGGRPSSTDPLPGPQCATVAPDPDTGTQAFAFRIDGSRFDLGVNLDGINNATRGGSGGGVGATVAGCATVDLATGIDNRLGPIATAIAPTFDLGAAIGNAYGVSSPDAGIGVSGTITLDHLHDGSFVSDDCVGVRIDIAGPAGSSSITGAGAISNGVVDVPLFDQNLVLPIPLVPDASACAGGMCGPGNLALPVRDVQARLVLDETQSAVSPGSSIGGFVFVESSESGFDTAYANGAIPAIGLFAFQVGLDTWARDLLTSAFRNARDLHVTSTGELGVCSSPTNSTTNVNANSVSVGIALAPP